MQKTLLLIMFIAVITEGITAARVSSDRILFLTMQMKNGTAELLSSDIVKHPYTIRGECSEGPIRCVAITASGKEMFSVAEQDPTLIPYDYLDADGALRGGVLEQPGATLTVRMPFSEAIGAVSIFKKASGYANGETRIGSFRMADILAKRSKPEFTGTPNAPDLHLIYGDSAKKRANYVVLSEGYTQNEIDNGKFITDLKAGVDHHFRCTPFKEYRSYFNVWAITVASTKSGVNGYFESQISGRLIYLSDNGYRKVASVLQEIKPDYDLVLALVNVTTYGGCGSKFATASVHSSCGDLIAHETGHGFCGLGDEYDYSDRSIRATPNTTKETKFDLIQWNAWIASSTPLPTPETSEWSAVIGLFEGAEYKSTGWYRPKLKCKMKELSATFCEVCVEAAITRAYQALSPIEAYTPATAMLAYDAMTDKRLAVAAIQPLENTVKTDWIVNDSFVLSEQDTLDLTKAHLLTGRNTVRAIVTDMTPRVRIPKNLPLLRDTVTWTVQCDNTSLLKRQASLSRVDISMKKIGGNAFLVLNARDAGALTYRVIRVDGRDIVHGTANGHSRVCLGRLANGLYMVRIGGGEARPRGRNLAFFHFIAD